MTQVLAAVGESRNRDETCVADDADYADESAARGGEFEEIAGESSALRNVLREVERVAPTDSTVLVFGETGTGKELIARAIHGRSARAAGPIVNLNCAAIPPGLLESELFGHEKGAFTGAVARRIGRFELAQDGTLFLDEVGEMPTEMQPKLLRLLQERMFERVGDSRTIRGNARLVAATNRDLGAMVHDRSFREDLYYRLSVFPIYLPPLRDRQEDIPLLAHKFMHNFARQMHKNLIGISSEAMKCLVDYDWPGNIRELQNVLERAVILATGPELGASLIGSMPRKATSVPPPRALPQGHKTPCTAMRDVERAHILSVLERTNWVIAGPNGAAARLGMKRSTLNFRLKKLGIRRAVAAYPCVKRRVLVGSDLSSVSDEAVRQGVARLTGTGDELALCHVLPAPQLRTLFPQEHERDLAAVRELQPRLEEALRAQVDRLFGSQRIECSVFVEHGSDYSELTRRAEQWQADLLIVGSHGRAGLGRLLSPSVAERVVRHATCSVLVARERASGAVLVATDLSDPSLPAIEAGAREAARRDRRLVVMHVTAALSWRTEPAMALLGVNPVTETAGIAHERATLAQQIIEGALERFGAKGEARIVAGDPATEILTLVETLPAELLVIGSRGRGNVSRVMLGSVAAHLVQSAPCSVLAVRLAPD